MSSIVGALSGAHQPGPFLEISQLDHPPTLKVIELGDFGVTDPLRHSKWRLPEEQPPAAQLAQSKTGTIGPELMVGLLI